MHSTERTENSSDIQDVLLLIVTSAETLSKLLKDKPVDEPLSEITNSDTTEIVEPPKRKSLSKRQLSLSERCLVELDNKVDRRGLVQIRDVISTTRRRSKTPNEDIEINLESLAKKYLMLEDGWIALRSCTNKITAIDGLLHRMLSLCPVNIIDIKTAITKVYRGLALTKKIERPPLAILRKYMEQSEKYLVEEDNVRLQTPVHWHELLQGDEYKIVEALLANPKTIVSWAELLEICSEKGVSKASINRHSSYGPVLCHIGYDKWALISNPETGGLNYSDVIH